LSILGRPPRRTVTTETDNIIASTNVAGDVFDRLRIESVTSAAFATLLPNQRDSASAISGNVNVAAELFDNEVLAMAVLGGGEISKGQDLRLTSTVDFKVDMLSNPNDFLIIGMLDPFVAGDHGFDQLIFRIDVEDTKIVDVTFTLLDSALALFDDNVLNIGLWRDFISIDESLDVSFFLEVYEEHAGQSFNSNFILGSSVDGGADFFVPLFVPSPVPIPAALWLFCSGLVGLLSLRRFV